MRIAIGSDHAGITLKTALAEHLRTRGNQVDDLGTYGPESVDYPDIAAMVAEAISRGQAQWGVLVCGTGVGMAMAANRYSRIRAAVCGTEYEARMTRAHNNANVLCLGERVVGVGLALSIADTFADTQFEGGRHSRRVAKLGGLNKD